MVQLPYEIVLSIGVVEQNVFSLHFYADLGHPLRWHW